MTSFPWSGLSCFDAVRSRLAVVEATFGGVATTSNATV